jgi:hypothetical protein
MVGVGVWRVVWCMCMSDVRGLVRVCGVWCAVCGVWYAVCSEGLRACGIM